MINETVVFTTRRAVRKRVTAQGAVFVLQNILAKRLFGVKTLWRGSMKVAVSDSSPCLKLGAASITSPNVWLVISAAKQPTATCWPLCGPLRIFEVCFTTKPGGSGLGLATVKSIMHQHGGGILIESLVGRGTVVSLMLPAAAHQPEPPVRRRQRRR